LEKEDEIDAHVFKLEQVGITSEFSNSNYFLKEKSYNLTANQQP